MGKPEISVRKSDDMPFCLGNFSKYGLRFEVMPFFCSFESLLLMWIYLTAIPLEKSFVSKTASLSYLAIHPKLIQVDLWQVYDSLYRNVVFTCTCFGWFLKKVSTYTPPGHLKHLKGLLRTRLNRLTLTSGANHRNLFLSPA